MTKIVVGVDGSTQAAEAVAWADREAQLRQASLTAVLAWGLLSQYSTDPAAKFDPEYNEHKARQALDAYLEQALEPARAAAVERRPVCDLPVRALLDEADDAELLVVSSRGRGGFAGLLLGSVSSHLLSHASGPLAIVRPVDRSGRRDGDERIVVGSDGSPAAESALRWAAEEARLRGATLVIVHAWHLPYATGYPFADMTIDPTGMESDARLVLDAAATVVAGLGLTAPVETVLHLGDAAAGVLDTARSADLIVTGSRGLGGFKGMLLGSVTHHLAHHAPCPLVIVPPGE